MSTTEAYRPLINSATGETIQFIAQPPGEDEDVVRFSWRSKPGGEITEHIHPLQEERFNITAGQAHFVLDGETRVLGPGETITVPAGTRHSEENRGSTEVVGTVELRPALKTREMHEAFAGLAAEGKTTPKRSTQEPASARRDHLALPSREPRDGPAHLAAEPDAPAARRTRAAIRRPPTRRSLGQPDGRLIRPHARPGPCDCVRNRCEAIPDPRAWKRDGSLGGRQHPRNVA